MSHQLIENSILPNLPSTKCKTEFTDNNEYFLHDNLDISPPLQATFLSDEQPVNPKNLYYTPKSTVKLPAVDEEQYYSDPRSFQNKISNLFGYEEQTPQFQKENNDKIYSKDQQGIESYYSNRNRKLSLNNPGKVRNFFRQHSYNSYDLINLSEQNNNNNNNINNLQEKDSKQNIFKIQKPQKQIPKKFMLNNLKKQQSQSIIVNKEDKMKSLARRHNSLRVNSFSALFDRPSNKSPSELEVIQEKKPKKQQEKLQQQQQPKAYDIMASINNPHNLYQREDKNSKKDEEKKKQSNKYRCIQYFVCEVIDNTKEQQEQQKRMKRRSTKINIDELKKSLSIHSKNEFKEQQQKILNNEKSQQNEESLEKQQIYDNLEPIVESDGQQDDVEQEELENQQKKPQKHGKIKNLIGYLIKANSEKLQQQQQQQKQRKVYHRKSKIEHINSNEDLELQESQHLSEEQLLQQQQQEKQFNDAINYQRKRKLSRNSANQSFRISKLFNTSNSYFQQEKN